MVVGRRRFEVVGVEFIRRWVSIRKFSIKFVNNLSKCLLFYNYKKWQGYEIMFGGKGMTIIKNK